MSELRCPEGRFHKWVMATKQPLLPVTVYHCAKCGIERRQGWDE